jgi:hypothetical protein
MAEFRGKKSQRGRWLFHGINSTQVDYGFIATMMLRLMD